MWDHETEAQMGHSDKYIENNLRDQLSQALINSSPDRFCNIHKWNFSSWMYKYFHGNARGVLQFCRASQLHRFDNLYYS